MSACGFHPVYAPRADGKAGPAEQGLAEIEVGLIPERSGQLLRQALQVRFDRGGGAGKRYDLIVTFGVAGEGVNIQQSSTIPSRLRLTGTANWTLVTQDARRRTLASGFARAMDGLNTYDQQFFNMDMQSDAVMRRIAEQLAEQMTLQIATWFTTRASETP